MAVRVYTITAAFLLLVFVTQLQHVASQRNTFGVPDYCLLNRETEIPCQLRNARTTRVPGENEYGVYETRIVPTGAGPVRCDILRRRHRISTIDTLGNDERVKFMFSPGIRLNPPQNYRRNIYVNYTISCPPGHLAFLNITTINLEDRNCFNPNTQQNECVDYVRVMRSGFGATESCGNDPGTRNTNQFSTREFQMLFRSSDRNQFPGFEANVICFRREDGNLPGCTRPGNNSTESMDTSRRRRDVNDFHQMWQRKLARMRRQAVEDFRFEQLNVTSDMTVQYENMQLMFMNDAGVQIRERIDDITLLQTFDANGTIDAFLREGRVGDQPIPFPGPGPITIVGKYAYFQLFIIDPRGILPNPEEMAAISNLTQAQYALVTEDNSTRVDEELLEDDCIDYARLGLPPPVPLPSSCEQRRRKRQTPTNLMNSEDLPDDAILTAIENENACNPVLRTSAQATIAIVQRDEPDRLDMLRGPDITTVIDG